MSSFDKNIRKKLDQYESKVSANMWAKIEAGLPANENPPVRRWWIPVFGVVLIASLSLGVHFYNLKSEELIQSATMMDMLADKDANNNAGVTIGSVPNSTDDDVSLNNPLFTEFDSPATAYKDESVKVAENTSVGQQDNNRNKLRSNNDFNAKKYQQLNTSEIVKEEDGEENSGRDIRSASLYEQYNSILKATKSNDKDNRIQIIEREVEDVAPVIPMQTILDSEQTGLNEVLSSMAGKRTICPSFKNVRFGVFAEAFYSNDYGLRDLSYNYLGTEYNYLEARNNTESANYSFSAGARVSFIMPSGIGAKTGFTYSQINEAFNYQDPDHQKTKTVIVKEYIWENNVIVDSMETTTEVVVNGELNVVTQNKYKVIDLPLLLTYEWGYNNRFYYSVTGGPLFNISFRQQGKFLNPETLTPVDFSSNGGNYDAFNTNIGTSLYLAFALNYQLGNGADLFVEPNVRHQLNKATLNTYELNQKYTILGLGFGIKYKL